MIILALTTLVSSCAIEAVNDPGNGGGNPSPAVFKDVTETHLPTENLMGNSMDAQAADLDNDGDNDLVVASEFERNKILINDGNGKFSDESGRLPAKSYDSEDIAIDDFNTDGSPDLIIVNEETEVNEYYLNNGDGTFIDVSERIPVTGTSNAVASVDLNTDGYSDIIIGNNGQNEILINNGDGFFSRQTLSRLPQYNGITQDVALADIDNDSDLDLVEANEDDNQLYINIGNGFFTNRTQSRLPLNAGIEETRDIDFADIDDDGDWDLYFANVTLFQSGNSAQDRLLINNQGIYTDITDTQLPVITTNTLDADFFDIDRDGDFDIIAGNFGSLDNTSDNYSGANYARVFQNNGSGSYSDQTETYFPEGFSPAVVDFEIADFNGDGILDIYVANYGDRDALLLQQEQ